MSLVMQTCQNDFSLNLCIVSLTSHMVTILKNNLTRSYKKRSKYIAINIRDLVLTLVDYQASYYKVFTSLKYIK